MLLGHLFFALGSLGLAAGSSGPSFTLDFTSKAVTYVSSNPCHSFFPSDTALSPRQKQGLLGNVFPLFLLLSSFANAPTRPASSLICILTLIVR
jgi:hypothetical protein